MALRWGKRWVVSPCGGTACANTRRVDGTGAHSCRARGLCLGTGSLDMTWRYRGWSLKGFEPGTDLVTLHEGEAIRLRSLAAFSGSAPGAQRSSQRLHVSRFCARPPSCGLSNCAAFQCQVGAGSSPTPFLSTPTHPWSPLYPLYPYPSNLAPGQLGSP